MEYIMNHDGIVQGPYKLAKDLENIDQMEGSDIYRILLTGYKILFSNAVLDPCFDKLKHSERFIHVLIQVCDDRDLTFEERIHCNHMLYLLLADETSNDYMKKLYYTLGKSVNKDIVDKLRQCGVDPFLSTYLAIMRKSSFDNKDNIARLNFVITCADPKTMTVQTIVNIYCQIFDSLEDIKSLFLATIRDTYILNSDEDWISPDKILITKNIDLAILSILNSLDQEDLFKLLKDYSEMCLIEDLDVNDVRISFKAINPLSFPNITCAIDRLLSQEIDII